MNPQKFLARVFESEWAAAYRPRQKDGGVLRAGGQSFALLNNTPRYWCADPFVVEDGSKAYVFFEAFDRIKRKGVLGYREIGSDTAGRIHIIIEEPFHLSYPCIYKAGGNWRLIPESKDAGQIIRYRAKEFPSVWEKEAILMDGIEGVDPTVFEQADSDPVLFVYLWERFNRGRLQVIHLKEGPGAGDPGPPGSRSREAAEFRAAGRISLDDRRGRKRPAGKLFQIGDTLYRPSQLCTRRYGEGILFNRILRLTDDSYEETEWGTLTADRICLDRKVRIMGVHTYNHSENWEVIDVEIGGISLIRIIGLFPRLYWFAVRRIMESRQKERPYEAEPADQWLFPDKGRQTKGRQIKGHHPEGGQAE